ncbi:Glyoxalase/bleomycin resistance protein/dioxygenase [Kribbella flavida DSM 17836]|uniref:Glyoxalase/bleomycin resistance protein/dioxygenase n=1 Tax=Kribbella flavida (strain DSM 17836 / JCM 10339 / NBRC 14399) TaxID=479435 RepID=D2Q3Z5_KRIFD|nr:VOC family protein [Kribbella flavida]ADB36017.1 Glyoxalase/bleomycin resistance protein/dioxygenase [Kribbella flavida DSM 17836]
MSDFTAPAWIDITATNPVAAREFYTQLFGWRLQLVEALNYALVQPDKNTLPGGIGQQNEVRPAGVVTYFSVPDLEAAVAKAESLGGRIAVPPWEVPGLGRMAIILDLDANRIGLWQD